MLFFRQIQEGYLYEVRSLTPPQVQIWPQSVKLYCRFFRSKETINQSRYIISYVCTAVICLSVCLMSSQFKNFFDDLPQFSWSNQSSIFKIRQISKKSWLSKMQTTNIKYKHSLHESVTELTNWPINKFSTCLRIKTERIVSIKN